MEGAEAVQRAALERVGAAQHLAAAVLHTRTGHSQLCSGRGVAQEPAAPASVSRRHMSAAARRTEARNSRTATSSACTRSRGSLRSAARPLRPTRSHAATASPAAADARDRSAGAALLHVACASASSACTRAFPYSCADKAACTKKMSGTPDLHAWLPRGHRSGVTGTRGGGAGLRTASAAASLSMSTLRRRSTSCGEHVRAVYSGVSRASPKGGGLNREAMSCAVMGPASMRSRRSLSHLRGAAGA